MNTELNRKLRIQIRTTPYRLFLPMDDELFSLVVKTMNDAIYMKLQHELRYDVSDNLPTLNFKI